jgi:type II secretory pathway pseudopilin PulG
MFDVLNARQQRHLATSLLAIAIIAVLSVTVLPAWRISSSFQNQIDSLSNRLQAYDRITANDANLIPQFEAIKQAQLRGGHYLRSETVAVAGAELQRIVKEIAAANGSQILSTQILPTTQDQGFVEITLKVRMRGELWSVLDAFHSIETNDVYLFIDRLSIRDSGVGRRPRQLVVKLMDADFELTAYMPDIS